MKKMLTNTKSCLPLSFQLIKYMIWWGGNDLHSAWCSNFLNDLHATLLFCAFLFFLCLVECVPEPAHKVWYKSEWLGASAFLTIVFKLNFNLTMHTILTCVWQIISTWDLASWNKKCKVPQHESWVFPIGILIAVINFNDWYGRTNIRSKMKILINHKCLLVKRYFLGEDENYRKNVFRSTFKSSREN